MNEAQENDLRAFLKLFPEIDESRCEFTDVPDLLCQHHNRIIGVEHTRLYYESNTLAVGQQRKPQELLHIKIVHTAHQMFKQQSSVPLWLAVTFTEPYNLRKRDVSEIAQSLADVVFTSVSTGVDLFQRSTITTISPWEYEHERRPFPQGVQAIHYTVQDNPKYEVWGPTYGYGVPDLAVEGLKATIAVKDARVPEYGKRCDQVWLLMVTNLGMPSSNFTIAEAVLSHTFSTVFDRLFLLTDGNSQLIELKTH